MANCYNCLKVLDENNKSSEHVIPNAIGGRLKSDALLCETCNNLFGSETDAYLGENIPFSLLLNIKRDRNKPYRVIAKDANNQEYYVNFNEVSGELEAEQRVGKPIEAKTLDGKTVVKIIGEKQAKSVIKSKKKKYPQLDSQKIFDQIKWRDPIKRKLFFEDKQLKGTESENAFLKIAINYYILVGGGRKEIELLIDHLSGNKRNTKPVAYYFYPDNEPNLISREEKEVAHTVAIFGKKGGKLICYIDLFSVYQTVLILTYNYQGEDIESVYSYDILLQKDISHDKKIDLVTIHNEWGELRNEYSDAKMQSYFEEKKKRIFKIAGLEYY